MDKLDRTRIIFIAIVGLALLVVCSAVAYNFIKGLTTPTSTPTPAVSSGGNPTPAVSFDSPAPIFAANYDPDDGLPIYICGADAFGSYFTLQQMQMSGQDVEQGFHLGIVPFYLDDDPNYTVSEEQRTALLQTGEWDCLLTTLDSVALSSPGLVTAIVDESAGADQLWGRDIDTLNELKDARIAFSRGSVGEYFVYYALSIARLNPRFDVTLLPQDSVAAAVETFNSGGADAVSGWEPDIYAAEDSGGKPLLSSKQMRIVVDVIVTSRQSVSQRANEVQMFHDAWFATLKDQVEDLDQAAADIAAWGHNDWTFVYPDSARDDLVLWLENVAQADLSDNAAVMRDLGPFINRLQIAQRVWAASGLEVTDSQATELVEPGFVSRSAAQASLQAQGNPVNDTFSFSTELDISNMDAAAAETLVVLPCRRFAFLPESTELTLESRRILDECVMPTLSQSVGLLLEVQGSSAWPGPPGTYTKEGILEFAEARAQSVVDYLVSQGIDSARFIVTGTLPPEDHWETEDPALQAEDRYVEMTLVTMGR